MNDGLNFYEKDMDIFCITGYNFPPSTMKIPHGYPHQIYISPRNGSWGWATWNDRWLKADWNVTDYREFSQNNHLQKAFNYGGEDLSRMLKDQIEGKIDSWSIRWCYTMFKNNGYCVYPIFSFIDNIGCDGTGIHCTKSMMDSRKNFKLNQGRKIFFPERIKIDCEIMIQFREVFARENCIKRIYRHCLNMSSRVFGG
jgi:hypothetical protein